MLTEVGVNSHEDLAYMSDELIESIAVNEVGLTLLRSATYHLGAKPVF